MGATRTAMTHYHHIYLHRQDVVNGVDQGLSFFNRAVSRGKVDNVGGEPFFSELKREPGSCGVLKKYVGDGDVSERRYFFDGTVDHFFEVVRSFKDQLDIILVNVFYSQ